MSKKTTKKKTTKKQKAKSWKNLLVSNDTHALIERLQRKLKTETLDGTVPSKHVTVQAAVRAMLDSNKAS